MRPTIHTLDIASATAPASAARCQRDRPPATPCDTRHGSIHPVPPSREGAHRRPAPHEGLGCIPVCTGRPAGLPRLLLLLFPLPAFFPPPSWTMPLAGDFRGLCGVACVRGLLAQPSLPLPAQRQDCHFVRDASNCSNPSSTECLGAIFSWQLDLFIFNSCKGICHDESFFP